ncbi:uncharacterized [Tachysurus ichikawai]
MNISPNPHVQIQQSLLTGSVHLCTSLFVWFERCFPSVRQASRRVSSNGAEANIVKMLGGVMAPCGASAASASVSSGLNRLNLAVLGWEGCSHRLNEFFVLTVPLRPTQRRQ